MRRSPSSLWFQGFCVAQLPRGDAIALLETGAEVLERGESEFKCNFCHGLAALDERDFGDFQPGHC